MTNAAHCSVSLGWLIYEENDKDPEAAKEIRCCCCLWPGKNHWLDGVLHLSIPLLIIWLHRTVIYGVVASTRRLVKETTNSRIKRFDGWMDGSGGERTQKEGARCLLPEVRPTWAAVVQQQNKSECETFSLAFPCFSTSFPYLSYPTDRPTSCRFRFSSLHALDRQHKWMRSLLGRSGSLNNRVHMLSFLCYHQPALSSAVLLESYRSVERRLN